VKTALLKLADVLALFWQLLPERLRRIFIKGLCVLESRRADPALALRRLFSIQDAVEHIVNERAMAYGHGEHPKHRLMRYHDFFIERIKDGDRVLDIGCGYGAVARSIARARPAAVVVGVDYDADQLAQASRGNNPPNLSFMHADATRSVPTGPWDVVILSNVLEHLANRVDVLANLASTTRAKLFLIRVPLFERDWKMAMRREVGANYYSDPDHKIEPTLEEFRSETEQAGLMIEEMVTLWGEIWAKLRPRNEPSSA